MNAQLYVSDAASEGRRVACGCDGRAACGCDGRAACGPATVVLRAVVRQACRVRCCDGRAVRTVLRRSCRVWLRRLCRVRSCERSATVVPRAVVRRPCRALCRDGRATCGAAMVVPRAAPTVVPRAVLRRWRDGRAACGCYDGRATCDAVTLVPRATATAMPSELVRRACGVRCRDGHAARSAARPVQPRAARRSLDAARRSLKAARSSHSLGCLAPLRRRARVVLRAMPRRSCRARCCDARAACSASRDVPRAATTLVPRAVPQRSCRVRDGCAACVAATVVPQGARLYGSGARFAWGAEQLEVAKDAQLCLSGAWRPRGAEQCKAVR